MVLVADEGALVGYVVLLVPPVALDVVELLRIAVTPAERRTGIGGQLMTAALERCAGRTVLLEVAASNESAIGLYRGLRLRGDQPAERVLRRRRGCGDHAVAGGTSENEPLILGIETSCDETGVGIVRGQTLLADAIASSVEEHARFGGVVPEVASRAHLEAMVPTIRRACETAGIKPTDVDAVAVTSGPGLAGALLVGVAAAKGLALSLDKPLVRREPPRRARRGRHLGARRSAEGLRRDAGVRRALVAARGRGHHRRRRTDGRTIDDAAGEAFDKVARVLGLPFPGGP